MGGTRYSWSSPYPARVAGLHRGRVRARQVLSPNFSSQSAMCTLHTSAWILYQHRHTSSPPTARFASCLEQNPACSRAHPLALAVHWSHSSSLSSDWITHSLVSLSSLPVGVYAPVCADTATRSSASHIALALAVAVSTRLLLVCSRS